jgi:hypothetical protein
VVVPSPRTAPTPAPTSVDFVRGVIGLDEVAADGGPAPAPGPTFPDADIGDALVIERDPADVPPAPGPPPA